MALFKETTFQEKILIEKAIKLFNRIFKNKQKYKTFWIAKLSTDHFVLSIEFNKKFATFGEVDDFFKSEITKLNLLKDIIIRHTCMYTVDFKNNKFLSVLNKMSIPSKVIFNKIYEELHKYLNNEYGIYQMGPLPKNKIWISMNFIRKKECPIDEIAEKFGLKKIKEKKDFFSTAEYDYDLKFIYEITDLDLTFTALKVYLQ